MEDVQGEECVLVKEVFIGTGLGQPVLHETDALVLEIDAGKAFLFAAPDYLRLLYIQAFNEIITLQESSEEENPDNDKKNTD